MTIKRKRLSKQSWSIISGIVLLIFAFVTLFYSINNNAETSNNISSEVTTTLEVESIEETTTEAYTEEATTKQDKINKKSKIDFSAKYPYMIKINRSLNYTIVYGINKKGKYTIPYKAFICSTGYYPINTPLGSYNTSDMYRWRQMVDYTYSQYAIRINGAIMLHSLPYSEPSPDTMKYKEYNKLGHPASLGCIRYQVKDIKWIYENCPVGTPVEIYADATENPPLKIPEIEPINKDNPNKNWDPTDPSKKNPWNK